MSTEQDPGPRPGLNITTILALVDFVVGLVEKLVPVVTTAIQNTTALTQAEKAALIARLGAALDARRAEVDAVLVLDPEDPANLPETRR